MKMNDYLWDKTGSDPEIEELETQLSMFRTARSEAPSIAKAEVAKRSSFAFLSLFRLRTAATLAMSLLIVFAASEVLLTMRKEIPNVSAPLARSGEPAAEIPVPPSTQAFRDTAAELPKRSMRVDSRKPPRARARQTAAAPETVRAPSAAQTASLTAEEREAYDQLMLALSITSSRLKMVQDKADGDSTDGPGRFED